MTNKASHDKSRTVKRFAWGCIKPRFSTLQSYQIFGQTPPPAMTSQIVHDHSDAPCDHEAIPIISPFRKLSPESALRSLMPLNGRCVAGLCQQSLLSRSALNKEFLVESSTEKLAFPIKLDDERFDSFDGLTEENQVHSESTPRHRRKLVVMCTATKTAKAHTELDRLLDDISPHESDKESVVYTPTSLVSVSLSPPCVNRRTSGLAWHGDESLVSSPLPGRLLLPTFDD